METNPHAINELERLLMQIMVMIVVRDPDGMHRIHKAVYAIEKAGTEMMIDDEVSESDLDKGLH